MQAQKLLQELEQMPWLAVTGRVKDWLRDPQGRLPVSCTVRVVRNDWQDVLDALVFTSYGLRHGAGVAVNLEEVVAKDLVPPCFYPVRVSWDPTVEPSEGGTLIFVADSMAEPIDGACSIEGSWRAVWEASRSSPVLVDLHRLRPAGTVNARGLVASGPESFAQIYKALAGYLQQPCLRHLLRLFSELNGVLRRGGTYKNGAITVHLRWDHPEVEEFLDTDPAETPWIKRCLTVEPGVLESPYLDKILARVADGSLWLGKPVYAPDGQRLYLNVCLEILLPNRGTCLLSHLNLGRLDADGIPEAYRQAMDWLCRLHAVTGVGQDSFYLSPQVDRQVGLGLLGLGSHLAIHGIRYEELVVALESRQAGAKAQRLAVALEQGIQEAAAVARQYGMRRAFTVAPTASVAYRYTDAEGWTTTPEISPPVSAWIERESETFGVQFYDHHPQVEVAGRDVSWKTYYRLCCAIQRLYDRTGLAHAISHNLWVPGAHCDRQWLEDWLQSPLRSTYYRLPVEQNLAKDQIFCPACAE